MTPVADRFRRALREAGSLADELPWWGWVDERTLLTLRGEVLSLAELRPQPTAGRSGASLAADAEAFARLCGQAPANCRLSLHAMRRPCAAAAAPDGARFPASAWLGREAQVAERCGDVRVLAGWCLDEGLAAAERGRPLLERLRGRNGDGFREAAVAGAAERLRRLVDAQLALAGEGRLRLLGPAEGSAALAEVCNRPGAEAPGPGPGGGLGWRLAVSDLEAHARHLEVGGEPAALFSLSEPPPAAGADALRAVFALGGAWTLHWEWRRVEVAAARKRIQNARRHYHSKRWGLMAHARDTQGTTLAMEDGAASTEAERLGEALIEVEAEGEPYGELAVGLAVHGPLDDVERRASEVEAAFAGLDAKLIRETFGQLAAWFARMPGQPAARQFRKVLVSGGAAACMAPLWGDPGGHDACRHLGGPPLAVLETPRGRRYRLDLFQGGDVGHTLVLGATGSGKSFLLNFLLVNAQRYRPRVCVLDLGGSYRSLTAALGGSYLSLDPSAAGAGGAVVRPFALPASRESLHFLAGWIDGLLALGGYASAGDDVTELRERVEDIYRLEAARRRLGAFAQTLPPRMKPAMARWVGDGAWGAVFDPPGGAAGDRDFGDDWQVVDISGAAQHPDLAAAALGFYLERLRVEIEDPDELGRLKLMVVDEAWRFLGDARTGGYLAEAARTWRKKNAALILASQSAGDILGAEAAGQILESLPHRVYLANPDLPDRVAEPLHLSEAEVACIRRLAPKSELYLQAGGAGAVLRLRVDPRERWLYTSDPSDVERRDEALRRHGNLDDALDALARGPA